MVDPKFSKERRNKAEQALKVKVDALESIVGARLNTRLPMGDLPRSLKAFEGWDINEVGTTTHALLYAEYYSVYKNRILKCIELIKNPPIKSGVSTELKNEISKLNSQLSILSEQNHLLGRQLEETARARDLALAKLNDVKKRLKAHDPKFSKKGTGDSDDHKI
jgi:hypothetical protein